MSSASGGKTAPRRAAVACVALVITTAVAACASQQALSSKIGRSGESRAGDKRLPGPFEDLLTELAASGYRDYSDDLAAGNCDSINCALYEYGGTVLHEAAASSDTALIKLLIARGADVNARDREGWTPLMHAADSCCPEAAALLLGKGANALIVNSEGRRATDIAKENGCREIEKLLMQR
ncbi:MAG TPA: ankyrin repeat domain-containing protein [Spirochaetota bacterium]|nr:ankyrin repeat domain-containing protein [Spirochaetota bacterium]HOD15534.1 ankyrin repeat domain-containing protein [Spirochaetota bacterium]HPG49622.1 ankyrin repeat domain-containing protein [Spirochaetota bacterium]HPN11974.1 ankyrin repeat domain-containing protein [Spirochaetota bacterium]HQL84185.1 ankyrin repeat domain-containing protein [Spirochaetota bacterium]